MGKIAHILVLTGLALPVAAHAGAVDRAAADKQCRAKERVVAASDLRPQARKPAHSAEKRYILM